MTARTVTAPELANLRTDGQFSILRLAIIDPDVVFIAQVLAVPESNDEVQVAYYHTPEYGEPEDIKDGMTAWIGTTSGAYDVGMVRAISAMELQVRHRTPGFTPGDGYMKIGITSEIQWAVGQYITVVREHGLWPKTAKMVGPNMVCDNDRAYVDEHKYCAPAVVMGPDCAIHLPTSGSVAVNLSAADSWVPYLSSSAVTGATWSCVSASGSHIVTSTGTYTASMTITTPGVYTVYCTVTTDHSGTTTTGHRVYYVWDDSTTPPAKFTLDTLQGDWQTGGWNATVTAYEGIDYSTVRDRAKCFIIQENYFNGVKVDMGPDAGYEQVLFSGWINGESIHVNPEQSSVTFTINGPQFWLDKLTSWPAGIRGHLNVDPTTWSEWNYLTYDAFMWHVMRWLCTAAEVMDIFPSGVQTRMVGADAAWGTMWSQISQVADGRFLIHPCTNRLGQLFNEFDPNLARPVYRDAFPVVMELTKQDWQDTLEIERRILPDVSFMDTTAMYWDGSEAGGFRGGAYGYAVGRFGRMEQRTQLYVPKTNGQDRTNELSGILLGKANNDYPRVSMRLAQINTFIDIAPNQYCTFSIDAIDSPRGVSLANQKIVPQTLSYMWNSETGTITTDVAFIGASRIFQGHTLPFYTGPDWKLPPIKPWDPWDPTLPPIRPPIRRGVPCMAATAAPTGPLLLAGSGSVEDGSSYTQYVHMKIRPLGATNATYLSVYGTYYTYNVSDWDEEPGAEDTLIITAFDASGSTVITALPSDYTGAARGTRNYFFFPNTGLEIFGFVYTAASGKKIVINNASMHNYCQYTDQNIDPPEPEYPCVAMTDPLDYTGTMATMTALKFDPEQDYSTFFPGGIVMPNWLAASGSSGRTWFLLPGESSPELEIYDYLAPGNIHRGPVTTGIGVRPTSWTHPTIFYVAIRPYRFRYVPAFGYETWELDDPSASDDVTIYEFSVTLSGGSLTSPVTIPVTSINWPDANYYFYTEYTVTAPFHFNRITLNYLSGPADDSTTVGRLVHMSMTFENVVDIAEDCV